MIIEDLIKNGESQTVEFKERITAPQMLARIISAFSNTDGGTILIGIREPNIVVGIDPERFENTYQQAVQRVTGLAKTSSEIIELNNKKIGVIHVEKAVSPVGSSEGYFTRLGESDRALGPEQLKQLFAKRSMDEKLSLWRNEIAILKRQYDTKIALLLREKAQQIVFLKEQIDFQTKHNLSKKEQLLSTYTIALSAKEPSRELKACYAQVVKSGKKIALEKIAVGDEFELQSAQTILKAKALESLRSEG